MSRPATSRLKVNPPLGHMPALQYLLPQQLEIDPGYQRSLDSGQSQTLVRRIAQHWNWDLCQPLVVARREDGALFVIDGQHRLAAARLRGDIHQLPAVVVQYACTEDEAASFVHLNQQRRALTKLDIFKAAVASGDGVVGKIVEALAVARLSVAPHSNPTAWKPGMVANIAGIEAAWRVHGPRVTRAALQALGEAYAGQVLRYAGTVFPGIAAVCADEMRGGAVFDPDLWPLFIEMIGAGEQTLWRREIAALRMADSNVKFAAASVRVFGTSWAELKAELLGVAA
jgi:hypothetical protein